MTPLPGDLDFLYGVFRMTLPSPADAEQATARTLAAATRAGASGDRAALTQFVLDELAARRGGAPAQLVPTATPQRPVSARLAMLLQGTSGPILAALVRSLDPDRRIALVLTTMLGLSAEDAATALNTEPANVAALKEAALADLATRLDAYAAQTELLGAMAAASAYHLRPIKPAPSDGVIVVRGDKAMVEPAPSEGLMAMVLNAIANLFAWLFHHGDHNAFDDDVGEPTKAPKTRPTATSKQFEKPRRTPSLTDYRTPKPTRGIATYRMPKTTPSTARLASRSRPLSSRPTGATRPPRRFL